MIRHKLKLLLIRLGLLFAVYSLSRFLFLAFNYQAYQQAGLHELLSAFLVGLRFDVAAICRINSVFIILSMLPFTFVEKSSFQKFLKILFLLTNIPFLIVNVVDYEYYKFTGQRASLSVLDMGADVTDQIAQLSFHYWYLAIIALLLSCALYYFVPVQRPNPYVGKAAAGSAYARLYRSALGIDAGDHRRSRRLAGTALHHSTGPGWRQ